MKLASVLAAALAFSAPAVEAVSHYDKCAHKSAEVIKAIDRFCSKKNIVVPSGYALGGHTIANAYVNIVGDCHPKQWVPQ